MGSFSAPGAETQAGVRGFSDTGGRSSGREDNLPTSLEARARTERGRELGNHHQKKKTRCRHLHIDRNQAVRMPKSVDDTEQGHPRQKCQTPGSQEQKTPEPC